MGPERVRTAWDEIGCVDRNGFMTRAALQHPKVAPRVPVPLEKRTRGEAWVEPRQLTSRQAKVAAVVAESKRVIERSVAVGARPAAFTEMNAITVWPNGPPSVRQFA